MNLSRLQMIAKMEEEMRVKTAKADVPGNDYDLDIEAASRIVTILINSTDPRFESLHLIAGRDEIATAFAILKTIVDLSRDGSINNKES